MLRVCVFCYGWIGLSVCSVFVVLLFVLVVVLFVICCVRCHVVDVCVVGFCFCLDPDCCCFVCLA